MKNKKLKALYIIYTHTQSFHFCRGQIPLLENIFLFLSRFYHYRVLLFLLWWKHGKGI